MGFLIESWQVVSNDTTSLTVYLRNSRSSSTTSGWFGVGLYVGTNQPEAYNILGFGHLLQSLVASEGTSAAVHLAAHSPTSLGQMHQEAQQSFGEIQFHVGQHANESLTQRERERGEGDLHKMIQIKPQMCLVQPTTKKNMTVGMSSSLKCTHG